MCLAIPGKLLEITSPDGESQLGRVEFSGVTKQINLFCVPEARAGDYVLVHAGMAIARVDEDEARRVFEYLDEIESIQGGEKA